MSHALIVLDLAPHTKHSQREISQSQEQGGISSNQLSKKEAGEFVLLHLSSSPFFNTML